ncbi:hypothetical protein FHS55_004154 [Angulomicrobium tetraedrale]|uniref:Uncharacterized protein n=1 Tax=Ancylobacter tetraedralis TaxID=217068 RepID=A0A839ZFX5_9HYPH|nr:hypothetical protein [Ancylobacter tetraedralis]MBB3773517.1 hypothetical protein [Ancylobacter tetraedralis]
MNRRGFILSLAGLAGASLAGVGLVSSSAAATPLGRLDSGLPEGGLRDMPAATPDGTPLEAAQWGPPPGPPPHGGWGPPPGPPPRGGWGPPPSYRRGRRRRVCGWRRDNWGRPVRRCWYVWR